MYKIQIIKSERFDDVEIYQDTKGNKYWAASTIIESNDGDEDSIKDAVLYTGWCLEWGKDTFDFIRCDDPIFCDVTEGRGQENRAPFEVVAITEVEDSVQNGPQVLHPEIISHEMFGDVRIVYSSDGNVLLIAKDIAAKLAYKKTTKAIKDHVSDKWKYEVKIQTNGGPQTMWAIEPGGMYQLVMHSKMPMAKEFQEWVCGEVLPEIAETGSYSGDALDNQKVMEKLDKIDESMSSLVNHIISYHEREMEKKDDRINQLLHREHSLENRVIELNLSTVDFTQQVSLDLNSICENPLKYIADEVHQGEATLDKFRTNINEIIGATSTRKLKPKTQSIETMLQLISDDNKLLDKLKLSLIKDALKKLQQVNVTLV